MEDELVEIDVCVCIPHGCELLAPPSDFRQEVAELPEMPISATFAIHLQHMHRVGGECIRPGV